MPRNGFDSGSSESKNTGTGKESGKSFERFCLRALVNFHPLACFDNGHCPPSSAGLDRIQVLAMKKFKAVAPGRLCLFGEHQVSYFYGWHN